VGGSSGDPPLCCIKDLAADGKVKIKGLVLSRTPINRFKKDPTRQSVVYVCMYACAHAYVCVCVCVSVHRLHCLSAPRSLTPRSQCVQPNPLASLTLSLSALRNPQGGVFNFLLADSANDSIAVTVWGSVDALEQVDMQYAR
jgi:hypothetical protein